MEGDEHILVREVGVSGSKPERRGVQAAGVVLDFAVDATRELLAGKYAGR